MDFEGDSFLPGLVGCFDKIRPFVAGESAP